MLQLLMAPAYASATVVLIMLLDKHCDVWHPSSVKVTKLG